MSDEDLGRRRQPLLVGFGIALAVAVLAVVGLVLGTRLFFGHRLDEAQKDRDGLRRQLSTALAKNDELVNKVGGFEADARVYLDEVRLLQGLLAAAGLKAPAFTPPSSASATSSSTAPPDSPSPTTRRPTTPSTSTTACRTPTTLGLTCVVRR